MQSRDGVAPHAGDVAFTKPNDAGLASTSLKNAKMLTRIVDPPMTSSPPISVLLKSPVIALICAPWPDATPNGERPTSGRFTTMMFCAPAACRIATCRTRSPAAVPMFACNCAGVIKPA